ncbi:MAG: tetratricopeptide repeat protein, partial [Bdellovibrionales bacterium]|nr:tetratricopeptide repeat protein [Bdellovibrionales bacterium]
ALQEAAKLSSNGDLESRLGQLFMEQESWPQAVTHLQRAVRKGGLKRPHQVYMGIGMSLFQMGKLEPALQSLKQAKNLAPKKDASSFETWILHIESELALRKAGTQVAKGSN